MSASVKERPRAASGAVLDAPVRPARKAVPDQRNGARPSDAAGRAYARRDERLRKLAGQAKDEPRAAGRAQFVLLVMVLFAAGLVATLWLSTAAAADSYQLQAARDAAQKLTEQSEQLHREVAAMESAPALAQRATALGMVPVTDAARLVVGPDGSVTVVGTPKAVAAPVVAAPVPVGPPTAVTTADGQAAAEPVPGDAAAPAAAGGPAPAGAPAAAAAGGAAAAGPHVAGANAAGTNASPTNGGGTTGAGGTGAAGHGTATPGRAAPQPAAGTR